MCRVPRAWRPWWSGRTSMSFTCSRRSGSACTRPTGVRGRQGVLLRLAAGGRPGRAGVAGRAGRRAGIAFMPEFARRCYPATLRLKELLATSLGPPRLILGHTRLFGFDRYAMPGPTTQIAPAPLLIDPGSYLLDWCSFLFQSHPSRCSGSRVAWSSPAEAGREPDFESFVADVRRRARWPRSPSAGITGTAGARPAGSCRASGFQVYAERGAAWLEMPERIQWWDAERHPRGAAAAGADRRRRAQRPVPPAGPQGPFAGPHDPRRPGDRPAGPGA